MRGRRRHATISPSRTPLLLLVFLSNRLKNCTSDYFCDRSGPGPRVSRSSRQSIFLNGGQKATADSVSALHTSTSRNVTTSLMTVSGSVRGDVPKGIVTNHGMPVRWSTAHYRFSRAPCTATLYRPPSLARSKASGPLSLTPSPSPASTTVSPLARSADSPRFSSFSFPLSLPLCLLAAPRRAGRSFSSSDAHTLPRDVLYVCHRRRRRRRGSRTTSFSSLSFTGRPPPQYDNRLLSLARPLPRKRRPLHRTSLALSFRLAPPLDTSERLLSFLRAPRDSPRSLSFSRLNFAAPPVERPSNSTTCREIKFVFAAWDRDTASLRSERSEQITRSGPDSGVDEKDRGRKKRKTRNRGGPKRDGGPRARSRRRDEETRRRERDKRRSVGGKEIVRRGIAAAKRETRSTRSRLGQGAEGGKKTGCQGRRLCLRTNQN